MKNIRYEMTNIRYEKCEFTWTRQMPTTAILFSLSEIHQQSKTCHPLICSKRKRTGKKERKEKKETKQKVSVPPSKCRQTDSTSRFAAAIISRNSNIPLSSPHSDFYRNF